MEQMDEYAPETPLKHQFCQQISLEEYEEQTADATHSALLNLINFVESNPEVYKKYLARKRTAEEENAGLLSYLKVKFLTVLQGEDYAVDTISAEECENSLLSFQNNIADVFNYSQESSSRRFSKRLASRKRKQEGGLSNKNEINKNNSRISVPPPPPPPPFPSSSTAPRDHDDKENHPSNYVPKPRPPINRRENPQGLSVVQAHGSNEVSTLIQVPASSQVPVPSQVPPPPPLPCQLPLQDSTNKGPGSAPCTPAKKLKKVQIQPMSERKPKKTHVKKAMEKTASTASLSSIGSIHDELRKFDRGSLKSITDELSPGQTPFKTPRARHLRSAQSYNDVALTAFNLKMLDKFKNVRSPPSAGNSPGLNVSGFTP